VGRQFWEIAEFKKVPGIGEVGAHVFSAIIEDPARFATAQKLIKYARLAITDRSSDGKPLGYQRLERRGHRELKTLSYHAWRTACKSTTRDNAVQRFYQASLTRTHRPAREKEWVARARAFRRLTTPALWGVRRSRTAGSQPPKPGHALGLGPGAGGESDAPGELLHLIKKLCRELQAFDFRLRLGSPEILMEDGARCRVRTCDFLRVKQALYH
jgi:hypothetical protein